MSRTRVLFSRGLLLIAVAAAALFAVLIGSRVCCVRWITPAGGG